jgi:hypothetical protein
MIYVLAKNHAHFRNFCSEFHVRERLGVRDGQVKYLSDMHDLYGVARCLILRWGPAWERLDYEKIVAYCEARGYQILKVAQ